MSDDCAPDERWVIDRSGLTPRLHPVGEPESALAIDWNSAAMRRRVDGGRQHPLYRASGLDRNAATRLLDATAGLGHDAYLMANLGAEVTAIERDEKLFELLEAAWRQAGAPTNLRLMHGDAVEYMHSTGRDAFDVIYLDPMYPAANKSAATRLELELLRRYFADSDPGSAADDEAQLLDAALECAGWRVVVKRPHRAEPIAGQRPDASVGSKLLRLDLYQVRR